MFKRTIDFAVSAIGLVLLAPAFIVVAALIRLDSPGPAFFRQERLGRHGRRFRIFKFRSMVADAHRHGGPLTVGGDVRVTDVGRFLRRHKIDELPQLINVLRGEMSMVGPRPEVPEYATLFPEEFERILEVRPGITHRATLLFRNEEEILAAAADPFGAYVESIMPVKMKLYMDSTATQNVMDDVRTIVDTVFRVGETLTAEELQLDAPEVANVETPVAATIASVPKVAPAPVPPPVEAAPVGAAATRARRTVA